jgi:hypothetical protein
MPILLQHEYVILCEGRADKAFLKKLIGARGIKPDFDIPFPEELDELSGSGRALASVSAFAEMLRTLRGNPMAFSRIKGVLLVADSASDPTAVFNAVCARIREAGQYGVPTKPLETVPSTKGHPATCVLLIPDDKHAGGLETLCLQHLRVKLPSVYNCAEKYLACDDIKALTWKSREKQDKARLQCIIAATNEDDPNKSLTYSFSDATGPIISVLDFCFNEIEKNLRDFCAAVTAM